MSDRNILVLNGPGLAKLTNFDGNSYGDISIEKIESECLTLCKEMGLSATFHQSEDEEEMFRWISRVGEEFDALIVNPIGNARAASVDIDVYRSTMSLIAKLDKPVIEVHLNNIFLPGLESITPLQITEGETGFICGLGLYSYLLAIKSVAEKMVRN
jgi:3-dehydroquinate dehydratase-2